VSTEGEWNKGVDRQLWSYWRGSEGNLPAYVLDDTALQISEFTNLSSMEIRSALEGIN